MIADTNVYLSRWPFRRLEGDEPWDLVAKLRKRNVVQAWAGSFDGMLHRDIASVNIRLAQACRAYGQGVLIPFGSINPKLPDWQDDVRRCQEEHKMPGIRLHPNYHGYNLGDPVFAELLKLATARRLIVQLALCMEDVRTQPPLLRVPPVDIAPLAEVVTNTPGLRLELVNCTSIISKEHYRAALSAGDVYLEISMVEGIAGVGRLVHEIPLPRVLSDRIIPSFILSPLCSKCKNLAWTRPPKRHYARITRGNSWDQPPAEVFRVSPARPAETTTSQMRGSAP